MGVALLAAVACGGDDGSATGTSAAQASSQAGPAASASSTFPPAAVPPNTIDSASAALFTAVTPDPDDLQTTGSNLAAGDINGDGVADLVVGAPTGDGPDNARDGAGEVYVLFGGPRLSGEINLAEEAGFVVYGASQGDNLGLSVAAADLNGDGVDDLIVGAPGVTAGADLRTDQGRVYVFFGSAVLRGSADLALDEPGFDFVLTGAEGFSRVGQALATGDVNGDGVTDLLAGSPFAGREPGSPPGGPRTEVGAVYVIFGSSALGGELNIAFDDADFTITGEERFGQLGLAVAAGDVNGDGVDDVITAAPLKDVAGVTDAGEVYIFYGSPELAGTALYRDADVTFHTGTLQDKLGAALAVADLDGDGAGELIVSSPQADGPDDTRQVAGEVYVLRGLGERGAFGLAEIGLHALVYGATAGDGFAQHLVAGDLDANGVADVVLGAALADGLGPPGSNRGEVYVFFGDALTGVIDLETDLETLVFIPGEEDAARLGGGLALADLNGDGRPELAISAARVGQVGKVYVLSVSVP